MYTVSDELGMKSFWKVSTEGLKGYKMGLYVEICINIDTVHVIFESFTNWNNLFLCS